MKVNIKDIKNIRDVIAKFITSDSFTQDMYVDIEHKDGSVLRLKRAFCCTVLGYIIVYTEHHGNFIYCEDEVDGICYNLPRDDESDLT